MYPKNFLEFVHNSEYLTIRDSIFSQNPAKINNCWYGIEICSTLLKIYCILGKYLDLSIGGEAISHKYQIS